jgi:hypothetical protein
MAQSIQETELDLAANPITNNCCLNLLVITLGREELTQDDFDLVFAPGFVLCVRRGSSAEVCAEGAIARGQGSSSQLD